MSSLPILEAIPAIKAGLSERDELVLEAPPGAGKTTQVPLSLLEEPWLGEQKILMLEPRRLAARAAAERMAQTLGEKVGQTVGYRVRLDTKVSAVTRIEVVTEGILARLLQEDPSLEGIGLLIFDEFHERSLDADLGLALAKQGRELFGDLRERPLKLLIMSATLDGEQVSQLLANDQGLAAPRVQSQGRMYSVDIRYGKAYQYAERIVDRVVQTVCDAIEDEPGSILVFLPGQGEIARANEQLRERLKSRDEIVITPLYGDLSLTQQRQAIEPCVQGQRKIVLATSIAETSLTIDGVRVVIDCGLSRLPVFDPNTGLTRLATQRVSRAAATQRAGRAGRLKEGVCYRLWSASQQDELAAFTPAEILNADLSPLALQLLNWGLDDPSELDWLDTPAKAPFEQALELLQRLEAVQLKSQGEGQSWSITAMGKAMLQLPTHPRLAHMMIKGRAAGKEQLVCELAALISERDIARDQARHLGADIQPRLEMLRGERKAPYAAKGSISRLRAQIQQYRRQLGKLPSSATEGILSDTTALSADNSIAIGLLLAFAYPDRVALRRSGQRTQYQMSNGRAVEFIQEDALCREPWLVILSAGGQQGRRSDRIFLAAAIDENTFVKTFRSQLEEKVSIEWEERQDRLIGQSFQQFGRLSFNHQPLTSIDDDHRRNALLELVQQRGMTLFKCSAELQQWRERIMLLMQHDRNHAWPDVSDEGLLNSVEQWLAPFLQGKTLKTLTKLSDFSKLDLNDMLHSLLTWPLPQRLNELAPTHIRVPSGSNIQIDYSCQPPVLAVKLQEMFGCTQTPAIVGGKQSLMVHLLSPARRPLQVTQDLAGFWQGSYQQVKKEMKGRYPKHPWPDNPLEAIATGKTKAKM